MFAFQIANRNREKKKMKEFIKKRTRWNYTEMRAKIGNEREKKVEKRSLRDSLR